MVTITDLEEESLPEGCLTVPNVARLCQEKTTHLLYEVFILNDRHALIDFEKGIPIVDISRELHDTRSWGELEVNVGCIVSGKQSLINIFKDEEMRHQQRKDFKNQLINLRQSQQDQWEQLGEMVKELQGKILELEKSNREKVVPTPQGPVRTYTDEKGRVLYKITKAPELPKCSGMEPTPRKEGSFEQWYFPVKGSQSQHTKDAIWSGIINSVRGEAWDLVEYVGFEAPIEIILDRLEHQFRKSKSTDHLQHNFFQLAQEKSEGIQQYTGRLENQYKRLKAAFPH